MTYRISLSCALAMMLFVAAPIFASEGGVSEPNWAPAIAKFVNFCALAAIAVYFGRGPIGAYLRTRSETIRRNLVDSRALRDDAEQQLTKVRQRLALMPGELQDLKRQGEEELAAERARLVAVTAHERQRLFEQARREIDLQFRLARRDLVQHGVELSMALARTNIEGNMTEDDQAGLIDRFNPRVRA